MAIVVFCILFISIFILAYSSFFFLLDKEYLNKIYTFNKGKKDKIINKIDKALSKCKYKFISFDLIEKDLISKGNPLKLTPTVYILIKVLLSIITGLITYSINKNIIFAAIGIISGFLIIDLFIYISDKSDIKKIRFDLADVYDIVNIQSSAGVLISNALLEAYLIVRNKRLKRDLAVLSAEISITNDISRSLDNFNKKYNSVEISAFVMAIKQSIITGQTEKIFDDISDSLKEANFFLLQEEGNKIKSTKMMVQMMLYFGIMTVIVFELYVEISKAWGNILN